MPYRQIAPAPSDETEALILICSVIERHVGRLEELLAEHEEIEADEAAERYDRAALDCSPAFERHRRYQSARHRELMRTLETLRKMRKEEFGTGNGEGEKADAKCQMADDRGQMVNDECQVAEGELKMGDEQCEVQEGGCNEGQNSEPMTEGSSGPVVGYDSTRVIDDSTNDKNGILSHEGAHAAGQPEQGDGVGQCLPDDVTASQKAPNEANLESKQNLKSQVFKSETAGAEGWKQSQSSKEETRRKPSRAMAEWLGRVAGGRWPVKPKAASCFVRRQSSGDTMPNCLGEFREIRESRGENKGAKGANHVTFVPESGWPLVCGFVERISSSHCAIRTTLRQLGLFQSLFQDVFAWLPGSSQELVDRVAISPSSSLPDRSTRGSRRSAPSTSVSWPLIVPRLPPPFKIARALLTRPGHESGFRVNRGRPEVLVIWLVRSWRGIVQKKSQRGEDRCNFKPRQPDHTEKEYRPTGADSDHGGEPPVFSLVDPNWRTYTMATAAQIEANRLNAQKSTGPKTGLIPKRGDGVCMVG